MKARQYARMLTFEDEETGRKIKRLWSFRDGSTGRRAYADICDMSPESRKQLIPEMRLFPEPAPSPSAERCPTTSPAQQFFDFYVGDLEHESTTINGKN